jgi:hypothetical protein
MALTAIGFNSGIFKDDPESLTENGYIDGNNFRFVKTSEDKPALPELIGGWEAVSSGTFDYPVRGAHSWKATSGDRVFSFGTAASLYQYFGGGYTDLTPYKSRGTLVDPFAMTNGSDSVLVTDLDHGLKTGDVVTFSYANAAGGLTIDGDYTVTVRDFDSYTITAASNATSTATGGGYVEFSVPLDVGLVNGVAGTGWGTGTYGTGYFGLPTGGDVNPRTWSMDNWGSNLIAIPSDGAVYEWQPLPSYDEVLTNGSFDTTADWTLGTGWSISGGALVATAGTESDASQIVTGRLRGGVVYVLTITLTVSAGSVQFQNQSADLDESSQPIVVDHGEPIAKSGTYTRRFYATQNPTTAILRKNSTFAGSIQSISIKPEDEAYRIPGAPQYNRGGFVDSNGFLVVYGTVESDGDYNALCVRWSDQNRNTVWLADEDNLAGEYIVRSGSRIVSIVPTRGQNLVFTDAGLLTMRFNSSGFSFDPVGRGGGLLGKNAAAEHLGAVYWVGSDGQFRVFRGGEPQIIRNPNQRDFWDNLSPSQGEKVFAGINDRFNEVWFFYPDSRDGNECSRYQAYNWTTGDWHLGQIERSAWIAAGIYENPIAFDPSTLMAFFHERGVTANGGQIPCSLTTGKFNLGDGENHFAVDRYKLDASNQVGSLDVTFDFYQWARGPQFTSETKTIGPTTSQVPLRQAGRVCQMTYSNGTNLRSIRIGAQALGLIPMGSRQ